MGVLKFQTVINMEPWGDETNSCPHKNYLLKTLIPDGSELGLGNQDIIRQDSIYDEIIL